MILVLLMQETVSRELSGESEDEDIEEETYRVLSQPLKLLNATVVIRQLIKVTPLIHQHRPASSPLNSVAGTFCPSLGSICILSVE